MFLDRFFKRKPKTAPVENPAESEAGLPDLPEAESEAGLPDLPEAESEAGLPDLPEAETGAAPADALSGDFGDEWEEGGEAAWDGDEPEPFEDKATPEASAPDVSASEAASPEAAESDLDAQIEHMLALNQEADSTFVVQESKDLVQGRAYYDAEGVTEIPDAEDFIKSASAEQGEADKGEAVKGGFLRRHFARRTKLQLVLEACYIAIFIAGVGVAAALISREIIVNKEIERQVSIYTLIEQPKEVYNNTNYIYINEVVSVAGSPLTLTKISADSANTYIYFSESFDPNEYEIALYDQRRRLFHLYRTDTQPPETAGTTLKFDALSSRTAFLTLFIRHIESGESASFYYHFENPPAFSTPVYITEPIQLLEGDLSLKIEAASFGSTGSEVAYSLSCNNPMGEIRFSDSKNGAPLSLREFSSQIQAFSATPSEVRFDEHDTIIGKMNFLPIRNQDDTVDVNFNNVFVQNTLNRSNINTQPLFRREREHVLNVAGRKLVLEGMQQQGNYIVLVMHMEDAGGNRSESVIDAVLTVEHNGEQFQFPGVCYSSPQGTDVLFDISEHRERLFGVSVDNFSLSISSVEYNIPTVTATIDLSAVRPPTSEPRAITAERAVTAAFTSRLAYKSMVSESFDGFSGDIENDRVMTRYYTPITAPASDTPMYAAKVINGVLLDDYTYLAVVEEDWVVGSGEDLEFFSRSHKIVAEYVMGRWMVTQDEFI
ncbi:MAG: hypothetical protein LBR83_07830 [Clostridiales bacterium]|jgi:hypothetical protein|nr:hypothetical protein [Clostridiales bacterium]